MLLQLKVRWQVVAQTARRTEAAIGSGLPQFCQLTQQQVNLLLMPHNDLLKLLDQVFRVSGLDFQLCQALVRRVLLAVCGHDAIGHENSVTQINDLRQAQLRWRYIVCNHPGAIMLA